MVATALALGVTVAVLAAMTALGVAHSRTRMLSVEDYISARNSADTGTTAATLIASGMGAWILFSPAEAGAGFGGLAFAVLVWDSLAAVAVVFAFLLVMLVRGTRAETDSAAGAEVNP